MSTEPFTQAPDRLARPTRIRRRRGIDSAPPADFVDWVIVERAVAGQNLGRRLTPAERHQAVLRFDQLGISDSKAAARCHVSERTITRDRKALGLGIYATRAVPA